MSYVPHTDNDIQEMLQTIGLKIIDELFEQIPVKIKKNSIISKFNSLSEPELLQSIQQDTKKNRSVQANFLGAGSYAHYIPAVIKHLAGRSEFYTAYTPYQPEISQGTLTAIYEFQSMICELTGLDIANASMYDGASALAEAALLATNFTGRKEISLANALHPNFKKVLQTYTEPREITIQENKISAQTAAVIFSLPSFQGNIEDYRSILQNAHEQGALLIIFADPLLLSALESPGKLGADLVVGEGQALGIPQSFGGPGLGFFAAKEKFLRYMPGRIVGKTVDKDGKSAFVLTMQTREQHIRREKATSNICSNQALCALMATIYMSVMGSKGMQQAAKLCKKRTEYAKKTLSSLEGFKVLPGNSFKEFVLECPEEVKFINEKLLNAGILGGYNLGRKQMLVCCTELTTNEQIALLTQKLKIFSKVLVK